MGNAFVKVNDYTVQRLIAQYKHGKVFPTGKRKEKATEPKFTE